MVEYAYSISNSANKTLAWYEALGYRIVGDCMNMIHS